MDKKLLKQVILSIQNQDILANKVEKGIGIINSSYTVLDLDKYTRKSLYSVLLNYLGEDFIDMLDWWLYESSPKVIYDCNNIGKNIEAIDNFIDYCFDYVINYGT